MLRTNQKSSPTFKDRMRFKVYCVAKEIKDDLLSQNLTSTYFDNHDIFYESIIQRDFKAALYGHKLLKKSEEEALDDMVFNAEAHNLNSENVRVGAASLKIHNTNRKAVLEMAMRVDAEVGYWALYDYK